MGGFATKGRRIYTGSFHDSDEHLPDAEFDVTLRIYKL
jgi:hypothetical protein